MGLRRQISAIIAIALIAAALVLVWQQAQPAVFSSTALLAMEPSPGTVTTAGGRPENLVFLARTYAARAQTRPVVADAIRRSELSADVDEVLRRASVEVSNADATISITGKGATPRQAHELALALVGALRRDITSDQVALRAARLAPLNRRLRSLERSFATTSPQSPRRFAVQQEYQGLLTARAEAALRPLDRVEVLSPPSSPADPESPRPLRASLLAFLVAAVIGIEASVAVPMLRRRRSSVDASVDPSSAVPAA